MEVSFLFFLLRREANFFAPRAKRELTGSSVNPFAPRPHVENGESVEQPFQPWVHGPLNPSGSSAWRLFR